MPVPIPTFWHALFKSYLVGKVPFGLTDWLHKPSQCTTNPLASVADAPRISFSSSRPVGTVLMPTVGVALVKFRIRTRLLMTGFKRDAKCWSPRWKSCVFTLKQPLAALYDCGKYIMPCHLLWKWCRTLYIAGKLEPCTSGCADLVS